MIETESLFPQFKQNDIHIQFKDTKKELQQRILCLPKEWKPTFTTKLNTIFKDTNITNIEPLLNKLEKEIKLRELVTFIKNFK